MHKDRQLVRQHRIWATINDILSITYRLAELVVACLVGLIVYVACSAIVNGEVRRIALEVGGG